MLYDNEGRIKELVNELGFRLLSFNEKRVILEKTVGDVTVSFRFLSDKEHVYVTRGEEKTKFDCSTILIALETDTFDWSDTEVRKNHDVTLKIKYGKIYAYSNYDKDYVTAVKKIGGKWDANQKCWIVDEEKESELNEILNKYYKYEA